MAGDAIFMLIPLAGIGLGYYGMKVSHEQKMAKLKAQEGGSDMLKVLSKLERMEQRLSVLEKLATDPTARLADDIERLRDSRA
jgi:hypothetical protein